MVVKAQKSVYLKIFLAGHTEYLQTVKSSEASFKKMFEGRNIFRQAVLPEFFLRLLKSKNLFSSLDADEL